MLHAISGQQAGPPIWFDLDRATPAERDQAARLTGLRVPDLHEVAEIESSSRLAVEDGTLFLTTPAISRSGAGLLALAPIGFVVSPDRLLTVRFAESALVDHFAACWHAPEGKPSGMQPFLGLLEAMVDKLADVLEQLGGELDTISASLFHNGVAGRLSGRRRTQFLQETLAGIGGKGAHISQLRDGLLGIGRIVRFVPQAVDWLGAEDTRRLATVDRDVASLNDYDVQLTDRVQFLLDATLGFISIDQNDTIKVLTVVSIVGIPPTFIASLYGMNFHDMPELGWRYGYPYALSLIALSIVVPLVIFWRKGWL